MYVRYRIAEFSINHISDHAEREKRWNALHDKYAPMALEALLALRGFYIKVGQVVSTRNDFIPQQFISRLSTLQDDVPGMGFERVRAIVEEDLHRPLEEVFSDFEQECVGAASIGQAHLATLREGNKKVCVKVQSPEAHKLFVYDLASSKAFCKMAMPEWVPLLEEIERQFLTEFDYTKEGENLHHVRSNMLKRFSKSHVEVPAPILDLCSRNVLVMEFLSGEKIAKATKKAVARAVGDHHANHIFESVRAGVGGNAPAHPPPGRVASALGTVLLCGAPGLHHDDGHCLVWWHHTKPPLKFMIRSPWDGLSLLYGALKTRTILNKAQKQLDNILHIHGHQILIDGAFNGDPHPGNILLQDSGALGLIDYGQVKRLSSDERLLLAELIVALSDRNRDEVVDVFTRMGFRSKAMNTEVIHQTAVLYFDRDDPEVTGGMDARAYFESLQKIDATIAVPDEFIMAARVAVLLRGLASHLGSQISVAQHWRPLALEALKEHRKSKACSGARRLLNTKRVPQPVEVNGQQFELPAAVQSVGRTLRALAARHGKAQELVPLRGGGGVETGEGGVDASGQDLKAVFEAKAKLAGATDSPLGKVSNADKLQMYALYKQVTVGDCDTKQPGRFDVKGRAKWDEWSKTKGMSKEDAMTKYISIVDSLAAKAK